MVSGRSDFDLFTTVRMRLRSRQTGLFQNVRARTRSRRVICDDEFTMEVRADYPRLFLCTWPVWRHQLFARAPVCDRRHVR